MVRRVNSNGVQPSSIQKLSNLVRRKNRSNSVALKTEQVAKKSFLEASKYHYRPR